MTYYCCKGFKGQSAIEYLMTYGWMLLVVAVVGGAIFSIVQSQSVESVSGFTGGDIVIDDFGLTGDGDLELLLRNTAFESVEVNSVNVSDGDGFTEFVGGERIPVGETRILSVSNVSGGDGSSNLDVKVNYDIGGLSNMKVSGTLSGNFEITESGSSTGNGEAGNDGAGEPFSEPSFKPPGDLSNVLVDMEGSGNSEDPYLIKDDHDLQAIKEDLDADYQLAQNINASGTKQWPISNFSEKDIEGVDGTETITLPRSPIIASSVEVTVPEDYSTVTDFTVTDASNGQVEVTTDDFGYVHVSWETQSPEFLGFNPIGYYHYSEAKNKPFNGSLDGDGHIIDGLYINRPSERNVAMIVSAEGPIEIKDIRLKDLNVNAGSESATFINNLEGENVMIDNVKATGTITGGDYIGGLFGRLDTSGVIKNTKSNVTVNTTGPAGGFVRRVVGSGNGLEINNSYATGDINSSGGNSIGGFAYSIREGTGRVKITNSYATGNVEGGSYSGGFVSTTSGGITISNSYATGDVTTEECCDFDRDAEQIGGLVAQLSSNAKVINSYSTGAVSGDSELGGLVAQGSGTVSNSYWDTESSGQFSSVGGTGLTTSEMKGQAAAENMNLGFGDTWQTVDDDYPRLAWESE